MVNTIPLSTGKHVVPQFVRRLGIGEVEMLARREENKLIYVAQLVLTPDCTLPSAEPIQIWFSDYRGARPRAVKGLGWVYGQKGVYLCHG